MDDSLGDLDGFSGDLNEFDSISVSRNEVRVENEREQNLVMLFEALLSICLQEYPSVLIRRGRSKDIGRL